MASFMPAACSPCAIDQAIDRLLATPKTTAFRPCKSEDMAAPWEWEGYQPEAALDHGDAPISTAASVGRDLLAHRSAQRPTGGEKRQAVDAAQNRERHHQSDLVGHGAHGDREQELKKCSPKIERVLHPPHQMLRDHFHEARVHGHAAYAPRRAHQEISGDGHDESSRNRSEGNADR